MVLPVSVSHMVCENWVRMRQKIWKWKMCTYAYYSVSGSRIDWTTRDVYLEAKNIYILRFLDKDISASITSIALREQHLLRFERLDMSRFFLQNIPHSHTDSPPHFIVREDNKIVEVGITSDFCFKLTAASAALEGGKKKRDNFKRQLVSAFTSQTCTHSLPPFLSSDYPHTIFSVFLFFRPFIVVRWCDLDMKVGTSCIPPAALLVSWPLGRREFSTGMD